MNILPRSGKKVSRRDEIYLDYYSRNQFHAFFSDRVLHRHLSGEHRGQEGAVHRPHQHGSELGGRVQLLAPSQGKLNMFPRKEFI